MEKIAVFSSRYFIEIEKEVNEFLTETNVEFIVARAYQTRASRIQTVRGAVGRL